MTSDWIDRAWFWLVRYSNWLEQGWTAVYSVGLVCGCLALLMASRNENWQYVNGSGTLDRMGARKELREEKRRVYKLILGWIAGIVQMTTPNAVPHPTRAGYVTSACVAGMGVIMAVGAVRNLVDYMQIRREARRIVTRRRRYNDPPNPAQGSLALLAAGVTPGKDMEP